MTDGLRRSLEEIAGVKRALCGHAVVSVVGACVCPDVAQPQLSTPSVRPVRRDRSLCPLARRQTQDTKTKGPDGQAHFPAWCTSGTWQSDAPEPYAPEHTITRPHPVVAYVTRPRPGPFTAITPRHRSIGTGRAEGGRLPMTGSRRYWVPVSGLSLEKQTCCLGRTGLGSACEQDVITMIILRGIEMS